MRQLASTNRSEMLSIAHSCYVKASECETEEREEEWLHHYMLGKIAEKMGKHPRVYLDHYKQVCVCVCVRHRERERERKRERQREREIERYRER